MTTTKKVINSLKKQGERITDAREQMISVILSSDKPLTAPEIQNKLKKAGVIVNKTTVYRGLEFLVDKEIASEISLETNVKHYEAGNLPHHHHLVCKSCGDISEVASKELENSVDSLERKIKKRGFVVEKHMLEFYGLCANCSSS